MYEKYPATHTNITGQKVFRIEIICTYIIDFEHKIQGYGRCCCSVYHQIFWEHPDAACK